MLDWMIANMEWVFGGIGVAVVTAIGGFIFRRKGSDAMRQSVVSGKSRDIVQTISSNDK